MNRPWLEVQARRRPDVPALGPVTYRELHARAREHEPASPLIDLPPGEEWAVALHARWLRGMAAVPVDPRLTDAERAARAGQRPGPQTALVVFTSGTTAAPKPVHLSWANLEANAVGSALALGLRRDERWLCPLPLSHVGGLMVLARSLFYGTTALVEPWEPGRVLSRLMEGQATLASLVPTQLARLLDAGLRRPPELRTVLLGGGPIAPALLERARAAEVPVTVTYGLTEATSQVTVDGWPLYGTAVRLAPDGEILVEGPTVAGDKTLPTGDLGRWAPDGRLEIVGRKADTIVSGGENVAPAEVEAVLLAHPDVAEAAVLGRPDPEWGEAVHAKIVPRAGRRPDPEALRTHCRSALAAYKVPKSVELVDVLPRTPTGKLLRRQLDA